MLCKFIHLQLSFAGRREAWSFCWFGALVCSIVGFAHATLVSAFDVILILTHAHLPEGKGNTFHVLQALYLPYFMFDLQPQI